MLNNRHVKLLIIILVLLYTFMGGHIYCCVHFCGGEASQESDIDSVPCPCSHGGSNSHVIHARQLPATSLYGCDHVSISDDSTNEESSCDGAQPMLRSGRNLPVKEIWDFSVPVLPVLVSQSAFCKAPLDFDFFESSNFHPKHLRLHLFLRSLLL